MVFSGCEWDTQFFRHSSFSLISNTRGGVNLPHCCCWTCSPPWLQPPKSHTGDTNTMRWGNSNTLNPPPNLGRAVLETTPPLTKLQNSSWRDLQVSAVNCDVAEGSFLLHLEKLHGFGQSCPLPGNHMGNRNKLPMAFLFRACLLL